VGIDVKGVEVEMGKEEIQLKEYDVCQQHINNMNTQVWQATSIFLLVNVGVLAYVFQRVKHDFDSLLIVLAVGIIFILVFHLWKRWINRAQYNMVVKWERMREIEDELGMWGNWYIHILDGLKSKEIKNEDLSILPREKQNKIKQLTKLYKSPGTVGFSGLRWIARLLMIGWGFLIIREFTNVCCPEIYQSLINIVCGWCN
jgi:hypothetical protein